MSIKMPGRVKPRVSVDLNAAAQELFILFDQVEARPLLCDPRTVPFAVARYEKYWLPLLVKYDKPARKLLPRFIAGNKQLSPPLDVAWVWFCHMTLPESYTEGFHAVAGRHQRGQAKPFINPCNASTQTQMLWRRAYPKEPWDLDLSKPYTTAPMDSNAGAHGTSLTSRLTHQVAVLHQFIYQVSLPHHRSKAYLKGSQERYLKFLQLEMLHADRILTSTPDIQLMAYAHMASHVKYLHDMTKMGIHIGAVADTAPVVASAAKDSGSTPTSITIVADGTGGALPCAALPGTRPAEQKRLQIATNLQETAELWEFEFQEGMTRPGGMFREHAPAYAGHVVAAPSLIGTISNRWQIARPLMLLPCEEVHASGQVLQLRIMAEQVAAEDSRDQDLVIFQEHCGPASTFADVRVFHPDGHVEAEAHMIGCEQLPYTSKPFAQRDMPAFTDNKDGRNAHDAERSFIIQSGGRDWGILMCRWLLHSPRDPYGTPEAGNMVEPRLYLKTPKGWMPTELKMYTNMLSYGLKHPSRSFKLDLNMLQSSLMLNRMLPGWQSDLSPSLALCCCISMAAIMLENGRGHKCPFFAKDTNALYNVSGVEPLRREQLADPTFSPPWTSGSTLNGATKSRLQMAVNRIPSGIGNSKKDGKAVSAKDLLDAEGLDTGTRRAQGAGPRPYAAILDANPQLAAAVDAKPDVPDPQSSSVQMLCDSGAVPKRVHMPNREASFSEAEGIPYLPGVNEPACPLPPLNRLNQAKRAPISHLSPPVTPMTPLVPNTTPKSTPATPEAAHRSAVPSDPQLSPMGFQWDGRLTPDADTPLGSTPHHPSAVYTQLNTPHSTTGTMSRATPATATSEQGPSRVDFEGLSEFEDNDELTMLQNAQYTPKGSLAGTLATAVHSGNFDNSYRTWIEEARRSEGSRGASQASQSPSTGWTPSLAEAHAALAWESKEHAASKKNVSSSAIHNFPSTLYNSAETKALTTALMQSEAGLMTPEEECMLRDVLNKQLLGGKCTGGAGAVVKDVSADVLANLAVHLQAALEAENFETKMVDTSAGTADRYKATSRA